MRVGVLLPCVLVVVVVVSFFFLRSAFSPAAVAAAVVPPGRRELMEGTSRGFFYTRGTTGRCTPQYWSSRREAWPKMVPQESVMSKIFGMTTLEHYEPGLTLLEATQRNDDVGGSPYSKLLKQSTAALLNSYARQGFPFSSWEVKTLLIQALVSEEAAAAQAARFAGANKACN